MQVVWQDLKFGARMLRKRAGFTVTAVLTLALGIGATTAIFSAVEAILWRALPLPDADRLVLFTDAPSEGTSSGDPQAEVWQRFSHENFRQFESHLHAFDSLAAFRSGEDRVAILDEGPASSDAQLASALLVSGGYFPLLGMPAQIGRTLNPEDDAESAPPAAVISHALWQRAWGGSPLVLGRRIRVSDTPFTIVGVMPPGFFGLRVRRAPDLWLPLRFQPTMEKTESFLADPNVYWLNLVGRLRPGSDLAAAQAEVTVALRQQLMAQAGPHPTPGWSDALAHGSIRLAPGARGISGLRVYYGQSLLVLLAVTGLVLLIACANVTNLLLSRAVERRAEIAMRIALGAARGRLVRMLLTESLLLAGLGGAAGLLLALWGAEGLKHLVSRSAPVDVGLSLPVLAFASGASILSGVLFGMAPALRAGRGDLGGMLRSRGDATGGRLRSGLAPTLVVAEVALCLVLLVGAGLLVRSLVNVTRTDLGFTRDGVLLVDLDTRASGLKASEMSDYSRRLLGRVGAVPGVEAATLATFSPMSGSNRTSDISIAGQTRTSDDDMLVDVNFVGPDYVRVLGLPLVKGREFDLRDDPAGPRVALVNQAFVQSYFPHGNPLGQRFGFGDDASGANATIEIVGVIGDARYDDPKKRPTRTVFLPILQAEERSAFGSGLEVRTKLDPASVTPALRRAVTEVDPRVPIASVATLDRQIADALGTDRLFAQLVAGFGALALILACVGLYGVVSQAVARRTNEVGIRMALGASRRDILVMILREAGSLVSVGLVIGLPASALASRLISSQLFGVTAADPATLGLASATLAAIAIVAGYLPARRASRLDPNSALRAE
ncbi:MAG TPA: ABC transporter permease [Dongiaceae bacterium]|nr:ABC transporter permease [Dongiaceae bacterium]